MASTPERIKAFVRDPNLRGDRWKAAEVESANTSRGAAGDEPVRSSTEGAEQVSKDVEMLAHWLDTVFKIPGLNIRFGLDALLGLVPGVGDTATSALSLYILTAASRKGVPRLMMARMAGNVAIDYIIGAIPLVGDAFDVYWKANHRNVLLLRRHLAATPAEQRQMRRSDRWFVGLLVAALVLILIGSVATAVFILTALARLAFG